MSRLSYQLAGGGESLLVMTQMMARGIAIMNFDDQHAIETYKSLISISTEGLKALQLINGGAVVAILARLGGQGDVAHFAYHMRFPLGLFLLGLVMGTGAWLGSYFTQLSLFNEAVNEDSYSGPTHGLWLTVTAVAGSVSLLAFAVGSYWALLALAEGGKG